MAAKAQPRPSVPEDAYQLGLRLAEGGDLIGAEAALRRAHEQGHPEAVHSLGRLLADHADATAAKAANERGDPDAAFELGIQLWDRGKPGRCRGRVPPRRRARTRRRRVPPGHAARGTR